MTTSTRQRDSRNRNRFAALSFCWSDLLFELDVSGRILFHAGPVAEFLGKAAEALVDMPFADLIAPADAPVLTDFLNAIEEGRRTENVRLRLRRSPAGLLPVEISGYCLDRRTYVGVRLKPAKPASADMVLRPEPGSLMGHTAFSQSAGQHIKRLEEAGLTAQMTVIDIPILAKVASERTVEEHHQLASSIGAEVRRKAIDGQVATALGDSSFGLLHVDLIDMSSLHADIANRVRSAGYGDAGGEIGHVTMTMDPQGLSERDLAKGLIYALGSIKQSVAAEVGLTELPSVMTSLIERSLADVGDFRKILKDRSFVVMLQPIINTRSGLIHHYEALCRFNATSLAQSPQRYITLAEEAGLIHEFDLAMVEKVFAWLKRMPVNNLKFSVAINISGRSMMVSDYQENLQDLLRNNPWTKDRLLFELTESYRMTDLEAANEFIQGIRHAGYPVCLDDFGAGAASFQYLSALEVDIVKIDGSAVRNAQKAKKGRAFLSALTELCARLGTETIAEMIDSPESLRFVRDCRCNFVQGFLFGEPARDVQAFNPLPNRELFYS